MPRYSSLVSVLLLAQACSSVAAPVDLVAYGRVWTGDSTTPWAQAVAVQGDSIVFVGDSAELAARVGPGTVILRGALVTPGLGDAHVHFLSGGFQLASVDLRNARSPEQFIAALRAYAATLRPGEWILGGDWDHEAWEGAPLPQRGWIDSVTPNNPVFVSRLDGHMALANSRALALAGVSARTRDVAGGTIVRDARGEPTGILKDETMNPVWAVVPDPSPAQADSAIARATRWAASKGVTSVGAVSASWLEVAALRRARDAGRLMTRVNVYVPLGAWAAVADTVRVRGRGDGMLRLDGVKGFVDGSLGSTTALFFEPYLDEPGSRGLLVTPVDSLRAWIGAADSAGLQVAVHAIGERANAMLLDIFDSVATAHGPRDRRFRIEHAQHLRPAEIVRFAKIGVIASMQPYHVADDGRWAGKRIGAERIKTTYAFRTLLDADARLAFGSDWTVAPLDPILGIKAAVTRQTLDGKNPDGWVPAQKVSVEEALRAYTSGVAYALYADVRRGSIKPGGLADLVVLDRDLFTIGPEGIDSTQIVATVLGGRVVYRR